MWLSNFWIEFLNEVVYEILGTFMKFWMCKFVSRIGITMELKKSCPRKYHGATIRALDINIIICAYVILLIYFLALSILYTWLNIYAFLSTL